MGWFVDILSALIATLLLPYVLPDSSAIGQGVTFAVLLLLFHKNHSCAWDRRMLFAHGLGLVIALLAVLGGALIRRAGFVDYDNWLLWVSVVVYGHVFGAAFDLLWRGFDKVRASEKWAVLDGFLARSYLVAPLLLLCWLPCYLSTYPGNFVYDATKEFGQLENGFLGDLPQLHSLLITTLLRWSYQITGSYNAGIAAFTLGQMAILSAVFSHMTRAFCKAGLDRRIVCALLLWWMAFPWVHVLVTSSVRDVLFAGLLCYSIFWLWQICRDPRAFLSGWWKCIAPALVIVLTVFSRNNNTGAFMPLLLCGISAVLFFVGGKKGWRGALSFFLTAACAFAVLDVGLDALCPVVKAPSQRASLGLYTQSLSRAYHFTEDQWSAREKVSIIRFFGTLKLPYVPENGDPVKGKLRVETEEEVAEFMEFWRAVGKKYPTYYADAILIHTRAMWYPGAVMNGYQQSGTASYPEYDRCWFYFTDSIESPGQLDSKLPQVHEWYKNLCMYISFEEVPLVSLLFSVGFHFWLLLHSLFYALYRKRRQLYLPLLVLLIYMIASAFVPLMLLRYFAAVIFAFPLVMAFVFLPEGNS